MTLLITLIIAAITYGTPLLFGTLGEILTEKSGNLNLGVEGIMFMGGDLSDADQERELRRARPRRCVLL